MQWIGVLCFCKISKNTHDTIFQQRDFEQEKIYSKKMVNELIKQSQKRNNKLKFEIQYEINEQKKQIKSEIKLKNEKKNYWKIDQLNKVFYKQVIRKKIKNELLIQFTFQNKIQYKNIYYILIVIKRMKSEVQHNNQQLNQHDQFESISQKSSDQGKHIKKQANKANEYYRLKDVVFPQPNQKTQKLFQIYANNSIVINKLKQQINRLQKIKKQSIYLNEENIRQSKNNKQINNKEANKQSIQKTTQFIQKTKQQFQQKQMQIKRIKTQIKKVDEEQVKILMSKNKNIFTLSERYFGDNKKIIDCKTYGNKIAFLSQQIKVIKQKKNNKINDLNTKLNDSNTKLNDSKVKMKNEINNKNIQTKQYMLRLINYSEVFSELNNDQKKEKNQILQNEQYAIPLNTDEIPISFTYNEQLGLILIILQSSRIAVYKIKSQEQNKSEKQIQEINECKNKQMNVLIQVKQQIIQYDKKVNILFCEFKDSQLFILTSDYLLRIYSIQLNQYKKFQSFKLINLIYCLYSSNPQITIAPLKDISFSKLNPQQLTFVTNTNQFCKININKYISSFIFSYNQPINSLNTSYLQTQDKLYFSNHDFDPIQTKFIFKYLLNHPHLQQFLYQKLNRKKPINIQAELTQQIQQKNSQLKSSQGQIQKKQEINKKLKTQQDRRKQQKIREDNYLQQLRKIKQQGLVKICCLQKQQKAYIVKVYRNGLLKGTSLSYQLMNPQVQIIQTTLD